MNNDGYAGQATSALSVNELAGTRIAVFEPLLSVIDISNEAHSLDWIIVGSETRGADAKPIQLDWVRSLRDTAVASGKPFFVKQLGLDHKHGLRELDGTGWSQFPCGFEK